MQRSHARPSGDDGSASHSHQGQADLFITSHMAVEREQGAPEWKPNTQNQDSIASLFCLTGGKKDKSAPSASAINFVINRASVKLTQYDIKVIRFAKKKKSLAECVPAREVARFPLGSPDRLQGQARGHRVGSRCRSGSQAGRRFGSSTYHGRSKAPSIILCRDSGNLKSFSTLKVKIMNRVIYYH